MYPSLLVRRGFTTITPSVVSSFCDIIFQPYAFTNSSITLCMSSNGRRAANQQAHCRTYIKRTQSTLQKFLSAEKKTTTTGWIQQYTKSSWAMPTWLYNRVKEPVCCWFEFWLCDVCSLGLACEEPYFMGLRGMGLVPHYWYSRCTISSNWDNRMAYNTHYVTSLSPLTG